MANFNRDQARLLLEICRYTYASQFSSGSNPQDMADAKGYIESHSNAEFTPHIFTGSSSLTGEITSVALVASFADFNVVSYMGTKTEFANLKAALESLNDWFNNVKAELVPFKTNQGKELGGKVHKGFLGEMNAVQDQVVDCLQQNGGTQKPLYVTGHSQGAAESILATRYFLDAGFNTVATYSFAAPRTGDQSFENTIPTDYPLFRIEFGDDIVPHVPPRALNQNASKMLDKAIGWSKFLPSALLSDELKALTLLKSTMRYQAYVGVGRLCYGDCRSKQFRLNLTEQQEADLFNDRLVNLLKHPKNLADHHHLAGTNKDVEQAKKGNYTAILTDEYQQV